ncbi:MAG TPA: DUF3054 domain-containing protein, partial [Ilumatobacteraceae bacterium]
MARRASAALVIDVALVIIFVAIGRRSHDETGGVLAGTAKVAAPFLIALLVGWVVARAWTDPWSMRTATVIWLVTVVAGMVLRRLVFDRGIAAAFIVVATITLGLFLL